MLKLPPSPKTFTTRHINCVVCNEQFNVPPDSPFNAQSHTVRQQSRHVLPVTGEPTRANTARYQNSADLLKCPRCGADNRNWLHILMPHEPHAVSSFIRRAENKLRRGMLRFSLAVGGMLAIFLILMPITFLLGIGGGLDMGRVGIVLAFMGLVAIVPTAVLTTEWRQLRLERHLKEVVQIQHPAKRNIRIQGLALIGLFGLVFPLLAVLVVPVGLNMLTDILSPSPPQLSDKVAEINQVFNGLEQNVTNKISQLLPAIEGVETQNESETLANTLREIESSSKDVLIEITTTKQALTNAAEREIGVINGIQRELRKRAEADARSNRKYFVFWSITVSLASFIAVLTALIAVENFVVSIDAQLPRPIFRRIANMMALVLKELKESVGVNEFEIDQIQWVRVQHNAQGGIDMIGIAYRSSGVGEGVNSGQNTTLVRNYFVRTDMWGWIQQTDIKDDGRPAHANNHQTEPSIPYRSRPGGAAS